MFYAHIIPRNNLVVNIDITTIWAYTESIGVNLNITLGVVIMKFVQIVFSPTGGTQRVADAITKSWSKDIERIDLSDATKDFSTVNIEKDDFVLIAVPSFGGRVPAVATQRLSKINGNKAKCAIVCVYGNRAYDDTLIELKDTAQKSGFTVSAAVVAVAEHSIVHQYATGRPDNEDIKTLQSFSAKIIEKFKNSNTGEASIIVPGNSNYKKAGAGGVVPKAGKECVDCKMCAEKCPVGAIDINNPKTTDSKKCISCMRCVSICQKNARRVNGAMVAIAGLAIKKACSVKKECELYI